VRAMARSGSHGHAMPGRILVIDDDEPSCRLVSAIFRPLGITVTSAHDGPTGIEVVRREPPDAVLLDLHMPGMDGMEVLSRLASDAPGVPVVMLTGSRELKDAVRAIQLGAFDYLTKPMERDELIVVVKRAIDTRAMRAELQELRRRAGRDAATDLTSEMGTSAAIRELVDQVSLVAASDFTVLILGETGTGKELVAQAVHRLSERRRRPFVALDCGAIPDTLLESELFGHEKGAFTGAERRKEGRFRLAEGGTCFLDEVGNLPMSLQSKLLRVLESGQVHAVGAERATPMDVRFVAATNDDLQERAVRGGFRRDLYFRLAQYSIRLPALRQRKDDIPFLAMKFVREAANDLRRPIETVVPAAMALLATHDWPGNVRELRNVMRRAVLQTSGLAIRPETVRDVLGERSEEQVRTPPPTGASLREVAAQAAENAERHAISEALRAARGNKTIAARELKTDYKTLHIKMKNLGLNARDFSK
jgi:DNA-binding NtrC family response regulator